jgi:hypothetical protein
MALTVSVEVPPRDHEVLASWTRSTSVRAGLAQRARIVLLAAELGLSNVKAAQVWRECGRLIARTVSQAEQLPVELGQAPRVGGVQDRLPDDRERLLIAHTATIGVGAVNQAPPLTGHTSNNAGHGIVQ